MNLIEDQIIKIKPLKYMPRINLLVLVIGRQNEQALRSLREQLFTNFQFCCLEEKALIPIETGGSISPDELPENNLRGEIIRAIESVCADYVVILAGEDSLTPDALLEYALQADKCGHPNLIYANEAVLQLEGGHLQYEIKPLSSYLALLQSLYIGKAICWKSKLLKYILKSCACQNLDGLLKESFLRILFHTQNVTEISQSSKILLIKSRNNLKPDYKLIPLMQKVIQSKTGWKGYLGKTSAYNPIGLELYPPLESNYLTQTGFAIVETELSRTIQLLSQLSVSCRDNEILIAVCESDMKQIRECCTQNGLSNTHIKLRGRTYAESLTNLLANLQSPFQIILNDYVQWVNRMNLERLVHCFLKPEVKLAVPQVATEGEAPALIYAGAGIHCLSLNGTYFKGRLQEFQGWRDMAWTNYEASMLTPYCIAVRKEIWSTLLPLHISVSTSWQFANELSFLCLSNGFRCEYSAQSAVWVSSEVGDFYIKDEKTGKINMKDCQNEPRLSGNYWHQLYSYGDLIEKQQKEIPLLMRSQRPWLKDDFGAYGLSHISSRAGKRVLILTHELSLTGAPLVLVQAVKALIALDFHVLVVSPKDGPLRNTYLDMNVPIIIDPLLQIDFEFVKAAHDFHFVLVSTVVLWQCIEALGETQIPVLWWIHDSRMGYETYLRYVLPQTIGENIHLYCGGDYAQRVIKDYRPHYSSGILLYGVEDFSTTVSKGGECFPNIPKGKLIFANIGQLTKRKGQDILIEAIRRLPKEVLEKSVFLFVGEVLDKKIYKELQALIEEYPKQVIYSEPMPYNTLKVFYQTIDCVICSSIDDPLPAFVTEALLMSRLCICSRNTAFNTLITSGQNGYLFNSGEVEDLKNAIVRVVLESEQHEMVKKNARDLYLNTFTLDLLNENFKKIIKTKLS